MAGESAAGQIKMGLGKAIKDKVAETIQNADVLSMLRNIVSMAPDDEDTEEVREKLQGILEQYEAMAENEKLQFTAQLKEALATKLSMKLQEQNLDLSAVEEAIGQAVMYQLALVGLVAAIIIIVLVFFGYKLYKSITDKEKKREEKKKAKQMKKKK